MLCDTCRRKKIKCDVDTAHPCTTCKQYGWECTFNDAAKKRGPPKGYIESLETRLKKMEKLLGEMQSGEGDDSRKRKRSLSEISEGTSDVSAHEHRAFGLSRPNGSSPGSEGSRVLSTTSSPTLPANEPMSQIRSKVIRYHGSSSGFYMVDSILSAQKEDGKGTAGGKSPETAAVLQTPNGICRLRKMNIYDDDLMVVRNMTDAEDADQIATDKQESIENLVPRQVLTSLIHTFFRVPHVTLPLLDRDHYLEAFEGRSASPPPPLLTYAICLYACFLLRSDDPIFTDAEVERDKVFDTLLARASHLVRSEYLVPRVATIQALVLLCGHPTYSTSSYRNWILAGMAVRMAQELGLHRSVTTVQLSNDLAEARKRLWYSVYITDRWCCAVMGRPLAIADSDCDVELPELRDTEGSKRSDYTLFVNFVKLSGILGEVLRRIYSPKAKSEGYKTAAMEQTVFSLQKMLNEWFNQVPEECRISQGDLAAIRQSPERYTNSKKLVEGGPMTICFQCVVILLHRPFIVCENDEKRSSMYEDATRRCMEAAKMAIDIARIVSSVDIFRFGWNFAAYAVFQAALIHVYNCTNSDPEIAKTAREYVAVSIEECLMPLSNDIPYGPPIIPFLQTLLSLLQTNSSEDEKKTERAANEGKEAETTEVRQVSPMSVQQIVSGLENLSTPRRPAAELDPSTNTATSLLLGGPLSVSQATWQYLFSSAGTPFADGMNGFDMQGWENMLLDNHNNGNAFIQ
ncbi:hypothetical protein EC973_008139 [Apophysomyces ossiformis]|uniref:Zn(2)-C6 fungal-type domain-containing protein n=1 Tax=Apophysomyces ossiformis TaxID=679940 RepID=A0A8H7ETV2_9FUNG|nr:hypothetical protein EC973_008139 [Apophysomyces ossiformis]